MDILKTLNEEYDFGFSSIQQRGSISIIYRNYKKECQKVVLLISG